MDHYPVPAYGAACWTDGRTLFVRQEDAKGGHTISLPLTPEGLATFALIMRDRHVQYSRGGVPTLGTSGCLAQADAEVIVRALKGSAPIQKVPYGVRALLDSEAPPRRQVAPTAPRKTLADVDLAEVEL